MITFEQIVEHVQRLTGDDLRNKPLNVESWSSITFKCGDYDIEVEVDGDTPIAKEPETTYHLKIAKKYQIVLGSKPYHDE